ncbi:hypothetical protein K435DRAFT_773324 [Dendrothele bispora CBS 962.96]|uniref:Uncharacterized protein n=1 Tax=Dendrothele bispora (strain CBS 962.96) TaxID=1314807 RepID=A0A4S8MTI8_DENBC|nr:hypothetical protein K435DRAFT_773324 [Dendrothele bispora CBS 962.96]
MRSLKPFIYFPTSLVLLNSIGNVFANPRPASLSPRDAFTTFSDNSINEGEAHGPLNVPSGSEIRNISIGDTGTTVPVYWSTSDGQDQATQAFIVIHGKLRDGDNYWSIMQGALQSAVSANYPGVDSKAIVVAPQFFSERFNSGQYSPTDLAFADVNAWQAGDIATHPASTKVSSIDAIDSLISILSTKSSFPSIKNITLVGHGGGGQLTARYAAVGIDGPEDIGLRYIVGDPSTNAYFTQHRPVETSENDFNNSCSFRNTWRYGFDNFTGTTQVPLKSPFEYFASYINRDIVFLIGNDDTSANGDQYCPALLQGGQARRDRSLAWWTYINTLARSSEPVQLFTSLVPEFAKNKNLPNWSNVTRNDSQSGGIRPKLIVVENAGHDPSQVLGSTEGRAALWNDMEDMPLGFRPDGWNETKADCSFCDGDTENRAGQVDLPRSSSGGSTGGGSGNSTGGNDSGALGLRASSGAGVIALTGMFLVVAGLL